MSENVKTEKGERVQINIIDDKMKVTARINPPTNEQDPPLVLQDVLELLDKAGIKFGINETIINQYIEEKKWEELFIAAEGKYPETGTDANFEYHFLTTKSLKPHISEDGHINYKEVDVIGSVNKDDILLKKIPATKGLNGQNVLGVELPGTSGKDMNIAAGSGTYKDPENAMIIKAATDGIISFNPNTLVVEVQKLYVIPGSVDFSTGNVNVKSSVDIGGDVKSGFTITTPYNISVKGRIEHATISCEGTLTVKGGIVGDGKQVIKVGGDIHSGYIRDQRIECVGGVYAATEISGSIIESGDEVTLVKPDGKIVGGNILASNKIIAGTVGNKYNVPTVLEVGMNFEHREKYLSKYELITETRKQAETIKNKMDIIDSRLPDPGTNASYKALKEQHKAAVEQWERMCSELKEIEKDYFNIKDPVVMISKSVYYGVTIKIKHAVYEVKNDLTNVMFRLNGDQIECVQHK